MGDLDGENGFGFFYGFLGAAGGNSAGDFNGDGFDDLIAGSHSTSEAFIVFGKASNFEPQFRASQLDGTNGFRLESGERDDSAGLSVNGIGDFNNDGFDDVAIGAEAADPDGIRFAGVCYVVFGGPGPFARWFRSRSLTEKMAFASTEASRATRSGEFWVVETSIPMA